MLNENTMVIYFKKELAWIISGDIKPGWGSWTD